MSRSAILCAVTVWIAAAGPAAANDYINLTGVGDWDNPANWDASGVPDTPAELANFPYLGNSPLGDAGHTINLDDVMYPGGLNVLGIKLWSYNGGAPPKRVSHVLATGTTVTLGLSLANELEVYKSDIQLTNVNLSAASIRTHRDTTFIDDHWNIDAVDSTLTVTPASQMGIYVSVDSNSKGSSVRMTDSALTLTNAGADAHLGVGMATFQSLGSQLSQAEIDSGLTPARLLLVDTPFTIDYVSAGSAATMTINNANVGPSTVNRELFLSTGGKAVLAGGVINIGQVRANQCRHVGASFTTEFKVAGADVNVTNDVLFDGTGFHDDGVSGDGEPFKVTVTGGRLSVGGDVRIGGKNATRGQYEMAVAAGTVAVTGRIYLGHDSASSRHGSGLLTMTGGVLSADTLHVGSNGVSSRDRADGYYEQTGGEAAFGRVRLRTESAAGWGANQFVVAEGASITLTEEGITADGSTAWSASLLAGGESGLSYRGRFAFDPAAGYDDTNDSNPGNGWIDQTLLAFGQDIGADKAGFDADFGMGELDLAGLDGTELLTVVAAGNFGTNALYVRGLTGLAAAEATTHLDSAINVYYGMAGSPDLGGQTFSLTSGGQLVAILNFIAGDANGDNSVNVFDLAILANNYSVPGDMDWEHGDFDDNDTVNVFDLAILANNYGRVGGGGGAPIPEPATLGLLAGGAAAALVRRRRK